MEHKVSKLGSAVAAAVLGFGLPALASAQEMPQAEDQSSDTSLMMAPVVDETAAPQMMPVADAIAVLGDTAQALAGMGTISANDIAVVSLTDLGLTAEQRYGLMQGIDASGAAELQQALSAVTVGENGNTGGDRTLAEHLQMLGVDPASVVAAEIGSDGEVTFYSQ